MSLFNKIKAWFNAPPTSPTSPNANDVPPLDQENTTVSPTLPADTATPELPENQNETEIPTSTEPEHHHEHENHDDNEIPDLPCINLITLKNDTDFCGLMLDKTLEAHRDWCKNLESAMRGENPSIYKTKLICDDRLCDLGQWLYKNEHIFKNYTEFQILVEMHKRFHDCAGEVLEHHKAGHFADAILLLRRDLSVLSEEVQTSLINLHQQIHKKGDNVCG